LAELKDRSAITEAGRRGGQARPWGLRGHDVAGIVKRRAAQAGFDPAELSGHSLRAGLITSAADSGASIFKSTEVTRHKLVDVLRGYMRRIDLFKDHAGASLL
jgi:hypothetical protein